MTRTTLADLIKSRDLARKAGAAKLGYDYIDAEQKFLSLTKAIENGEPDVIIEGHTDSSGSNEINELLSQQRSDSVRQYLLANKTLSSDRIVSVGYGSAKPLASNATEEGRAVNRRIDVIIQPRVQVGGS